MKVIVFGNGDPAILLTDILIDNSIEVLNIEQDYIRQDKTQLKLSNYCHHRNIALNSFNNLDAKDYDLIIVKNYQRILSAEFLKDKKNKIINIHMGLLPKYRGNSANSCAILNGEKNVGYTIHYIEDELDGGDILYQYAYPYNIDETYFNAKQGINNDIRNNIARICKKWQFGKLNPVSQKNQEFIYSAKMRPSDGVIRSWSQTTDHYLRMHYVFSKPLGTGLKFIFGDKLFEIEKISIIPKFLKSKGIEGSIVNIVKGSLWVKTKDTAVSLDLICSNGSKIDTRKRFRIGNRLNTEKLL